MNFKDFIDFHFSRRSHFLTLSWGCQKTDNRCISRSMYDIYPMHTLVTRLPALHKKMNGLLLSWICVFAITLKIIVFLNYQLKNCTEIFFLYSSYFFLTKLSYKILRQLFPRDAFFFSDLSNVYSFCWE